MSISEPVVGRIKIAVVALSMLPCVRLAWLATQDGLGANPIEFITRSTGWWTLSFLMVTLAITPLRRVSGWHWLIRLRRTVGLCAFAYALIHFLIYLWLDQFFDAAAIMKDILKRPFITVGFAAFLLLLPLAATSTNSMMRRLGGRRWQHLHRCIYAIAVLGVTHYWWLVKEDLREPILFAMVLTLLLGARILRVRHSTTQFKQPD